MEKQNGKKAEYDQYNHVWCLSPGAYTLLYRTPQNTLYFLLRVYLLRAVGLDTLCTYSRSGSIRSQLYNIIYVRALGVFGRLYTASLFCETD